MQYFEFVFDKNNSDELDNLIRKKIRIINKRIHYNIKTDVFGGDHIYEMIAVVNYINKSFKQKIPITFNIGQFEFYDKLVYIILESFCYYMINIRKHDVLIIFKANHTIWSEGIIYSPLVNIGDKAKFVKKFENDLSMYHFRRLIPRKEECEETYLSSLMQEINCFLYNNAINEELSTQLAEVLIELVGNASEHGNSECIIDLDITKGTYSKNQIEDNGIYYGMNAVVLNFSNKLFYEPLKNKLSRQTQFDERYNYVLAAREYHLSNLNDNYGENDFYTISSFQHKISGNIEKNRVGGTGLTRLLRSLEENADSHLCYMLSGNRILFFEREYMMYDSNKLLGFNSTKNYLSEIPSYRVFKTIRTFVPGVAYNLNYAIKKEW